MATMEAGRVSHLLPEHRRCLEEFSHDLRDVFLDPASVTAAVDALGVALDEGTPNAWTAVVLLISELLASPAVDAHAAARRRLAAFVRENADLLRAAS